MTCFFYCPHKGRGGVGTTSLPVPCSPNSGKNFGGQNQRSFCFQPEVAEPLKRFIYFQGTIFFDFQAGTCFQYRACLFLAPLFEESVTPEPVETSGMMTFWKPSGTLPLLQFFGQSQLAALPGVPPSRNWCFAAALG